MWRRSSLTVHDLLKHAETLEGWAISPNVPKPTGAFTIGIRPEDLSVREPNATDFDFTTKVRIDSIELVGAESYVHGKFANSQDPVFRVPGRSIRQIDDYVAVGALAKDLHVFNDRGRRVD
ncbi:hypothetical protein ASD52_04815 [Ensifer sp. Root142]|nr:hypothetical protein ASD52_04815 [Ensifer sp. Root142]